MSFLRRLFGLGREEEPTPPAPPTPPESPGPPKMDEELERLRSIGRPGGPEEAEVLQLIRNTTDSPRELEAIRAVDAALALGGVTEPVRLTCARMQSQRGDRAGALRFLEDVTTEPSLMLRADLLYQDERVAQALSVIERVLARNIDAVGARERHLRWRRELAPHQDLEPSRVADETLAVPTLERSPFRISREVARGGAGTIYEAHDDLLKRRIALKVYHRASMDQEQMQREAQTAVRFAGQGVIRIFDVDYEQGWIALEWIEIGSVRELLAGIANTDAYLAPENLRASAVRLAQTLARVHRAGIVHADVKPSNVLMRGVDDPVLGDFGIAVERGQRSLGGSAGFLSPERLAGNPVEADDDVYGFGRIVDDLLLHASPGGGDHPPLIGTGPAGGLRRVAEVCMKPRTQRPEDGAELLSLLGQST